MPKPILPANHGTPTNSHRRTQAASETAGIPLTHYATLKSGDNYRMLDPQRQGNPWSFVNGVPVAVPQHVKEKLETTAMDSVTQTTGNVSKSIDVCKFDFSPVPAKAQTSEPNTGGGSLHLHGTAAPSAAAGMEGGGPSGGDATH